MKNNKLNEAVKLLQIVIHDSVYYIVNAYGFIWC